MIAKLIAAGDTREEAFDRLAAALRATEIGGVTTNLPFLRWLVAHPLVRAGRVTTAFLTENPPLSEPPRSAPAVAWSAPWRMNLPSPPSRPAPDVDSALGASAAGAQESTIKAPMPGTVIRVLVEPGAEVAARQPLVVIEAMKMETPLVSPVRRDSARGPRRGGRPRRRWRPPRRARRLAGAISDATRPSPPREVSAQRRGRPRSSRRSFAPSWGRASAASSLRPCRP